VGTLSRGGYRSLLEAGIRIFEWQGPMIHAKTMVADGLWSRIGSSNMNSASLLGNWEIDVGVLGADLALQMEGLFLADLASSREIVLPGSVSVGFPGGREVPSAVPAQTTLDPGRTLLERLEKWREGSGAPATWAIPDLVRAGSTLGDAIAGHRTLGREDRAVLGTTSLLILGIALIAGFLPWLVGWFVALMAGWLGLVLGIRGLVQARRARQEEAVREGEALAARAGTGGEPEEEVEAGDAAEDGSSGVEAS
jgi:cardiolipin synthase